MEIIDNAVKKVCQSDKLSDPHSREFMLEAFKNAPSPEDFDPWRTPQDVIDDAMMRYSSTYNDILERLLKEYDDA
jgi:hypothetical protein